jgi:uncharacterized protein YggT (Ycf19 family)
MNNRDVLERLIDFFIGIVEIILAFRIFFRLLSANPTAPFVHWIYQTSDVIMAPFRGVFPTATIENGMVLDISAIFAGVVYLIFAYVVIGLLSLVPAPKR